MFPAWNGFWWQSLNGAEKDEWIIKQIGWVIISIFSIYNLPIYNYANNYNILIDISLLLHCPYAQSFPSRPQKQVNQAQTINLTRQLLPAQIPRVIFPLNLGSSINTKPPHPNPKPISSNLIAHSAFKISKLSVAPPLPNPRLTKHRGINISMNPPIPQNTKIKFPLKNHSPSAPSTPARHPAKLTLTTQKITGRLLWAKLKKCNIKVITMSCSTLNLDLMWTQRNNFKIKLKNSNNNSSKKPTKRPKPPIKLKTWSTNFPTLKKIFKKHKNKKATWCHKL